MSSNISITDNLPGRGHGIEVGRTWETGRGGPRRERTWERTGGRGRTWEGEDLEKERENLGEGGEPGRERTWRGKTWEGEDLERENLGGRGRTWEGEDLEMERETEGEPGRGPGSWIFGIRRPVV